MSPRPVPASAPPRVLDRLRRAPDGPVPVLHRGPQAVYVEVEGRCVGVVASAAVGVPCALRLATPDLGALAARRASVANGILNLDDTPLVIGRLVDVRVPRLRRSVAERVERVEPVETSHLLQQIGRGPGLTPEADDVLCGFLAVQRAAGVETPELDAAVLAALDRTGLLSATLLECAVLGEVVGEFAAWVAALGTPLEGAAATALARVGHTSGTALLRGGRLALGHHRRVGTHAA